MTKSKSGAKSLTANWEKDWHVADGDDDLSRRLIPVFKSYLAALQKKGVAKSTLNRHAGSCHALGGYIVDRVFNYQWDSYEETESGEEILLHYLDGCDGPLIHQDNESWQREIDTTCRKLYKFLVRKII